MAIDTLSSVKVNLGVSGTGDDTLLGQLQAAADAFIEQHCGRAFAGGTFTEYHASGQRLLFLANFPVAGVTSVKVDPNGAFGAETQLAASAYAVLSDRGVIVSRGGAFGGGSVPNAVQVVYATATGAVPAAVGRAYADLIGHWYRQAKTNATLGHLNLVSRNESGVETSYATYVSQYRVPEQVTAALAMYRVPAM
jgi:hypothetical protein